MRAIVVEDDADLRELTREVLEEAGWSVDVAEDGIAALRGLRHVMPDAIVLDLRVPLPDGVDILRLLRATEVGRRIPVVVTTGATVGDDVRGLASAVLTKPFSMARLVAVLDSVRPGAAPSAP